MSSGSATTYLPPRQRPQPVQRIARWALITVSTLVVCGALYLFFRGTKPRNLEWQKGASQATQKTSLADGWVQGLPDEPVATEPPPKPQPPIDEQARRELKRLKEEQAERDERHQKELEEIRKLLAERKPAPATAPPVKQVKRPTLGYISHERKVVTTQEDDLILTPGTFIQGTLQTILNSEVPGYFTIKTSRPVFDATGQVLLIPQGQSIVARDQSGSLLFGNERIPTFALTLALPGGREVDLGDAPVMDAAGTNGLTGEVFNHTWRLIWTSVLIEGLRLGQQVAQQEISQSGEGVHISGVGQYSGNLAQQRLGRAQDTRPTIIAAAGQVVNVLVTKAIRVSPAVIATR